VNFNSGEGDSSLEWVVSDKPLDINNTNDFIYALGQEGVFILPQATLKSYIDYAIQSGQYKELDDVSVGGKNAKVLTNIDTFGTGHRAYALETKSGLLIINIISDTKYLLYSEKFVNSFKFTN
jgi:hypothetical protein